MVDITASMVQKLRSQTGCGIMDCKKALIKTKGDEQKAFDYLRKKGLAKAEKRAGRTTYEGIVYSYIHPGDKLGVLVEINCESDFVAKTEDFKNFAKNIAMHVAASNPSGLNPEDIPEEVIEKEKEIFRSQAIEQGKPEKIINKIVEGQVKKFFSESCLINQAYIKDTQKTIAEITTEIIAKLGENIQIKRFVRFQIGE
ncbi:MAG: elongation factor Ts [Desulfobacteraceae bacterium 4572_130]|nr:MAG: elongation factor Ts [Desulfobacteraceae bacterium 4572_130]